MPRMPAWWPRGTPTPERERQPALTAAAQVLERGRQQIGPASSREEWQQTLWDNFRTVGEYGFAVQWTAGMVGRCRFAAAVQEPGNDEPTLLDVPDGQAPPLPVQVAARLGGTTGGRSELLSRLATHLVIAGESWLVGEEDQDGTWGWQIYSNEEIRTRGKARAGGVGAEQVPNIQVVDDDASAAANRVVWRPLPPAPDRRRVSRLWRPDPQYHWRAWSPSQAAIADMARLELANRHIQATLLSRLAVAGILLIPDAATFPIRPELADAPNPLAAELIETAQIAIKNPGSAAGVLPLVIPLPGHLIEQVKQISFASPLDDRILDLRDRDIRKLATALDLPAEILLGLGDVNHWSGWLINEDGFKQHVAPLVELICWLLTVSYHQPMLEAAGFDGPLDQQVIWYDPSEIVLRPDRSDNAVAVFDRGALSERALRRETGMDEADAPTPEEWEEIAYKQLAKDPQMAETAISRVTGTPPPADIGGNGQGNGQVPTGPVPAPQPSGPPPTDQNPPPPPAPDTPAARLRTNGQDRRPVP